jgi:putative nucleotidyltransferase with HDIG domain
MLISDEHDSTISDPTATLSSVTVADRFSTASRELRALLERTFDTSLAMFDGETGELLSAAADHPMDDWARYGELCREVSRRGRVELIGEADPFVVLAVPGSGCEGDAPVAAAVFLTRHAEPAEDLSHAAEQLGMDAADAPAWAHRQIPWALPALERVGDLVLAHLRADKRTKDVELEARNLSVNLASTYEEISLLYRLTQHLKISESDEDLGRVALEWLAEVLPADGLALQLVAAVPPDESFRREGNAPPRLLSHGCCPIDNTQFTAILDYLGPGVSGRPFVVNCPVTAHADWRWPQVRQMIAVALAEGENVFGWVAAFNHVEDGEFGTVEANLLSSVAAILGIHSGNIELYRHQSELLAGIVRALTSAIDAKDPYTCGHSDRVARVAVRLAEELGCDAKTLNTIYLSGLLHDIGKIGVDDHILRKAGKLSDAEYEHVKKHAETGYRILRDLRKLGDVLPVVLHHHESWDGSGYPHQLDAEAIPLSARIVAVADAYDAMGSDRPYRKGMPAEKIDAIFRAGAGQQWDPQVVEAFFRARDEIQAISHLEQGSIAPPAPTS